MRKIFLLLASLPFLAQAQTTFTDNFSNGLTQWQNTANYTIVNGELRLNATTTGASGIVASAPVRDSASWEFYWRTELLPSTSNQVQVFLQSDNANLSGSLNGYYVQIGESNADFIRLYKKTGATATLLATSTLSFATTPTRNLKARMRVTRNAAGDWKMYADTTGGTNYNLEATATDNTHSSGSFFGFNTKNSSTLLDKVFYDDVRISPLFVDNVAPSLSSVIALTQTTIDVRFDEPLTAITANNAANYTLNNGGVVTAAVQDAVDFALVHLTVQPLVNATNYTLTTTGLKDAAGNASVAQSRSFTFVNIEAAALHDILINEIMADVNPVVGLPAVEWLELYNRSNKYIDASTLQIKTGSSTLSTLPAAVLAPNSYTIVTKSGGNEAILASFGTVLGITSFALSDGGATIILQTTSAAEINTVVYADTWYNDTNKDNGGWSLERKNPSQPCATSSNWTASNDTRGGTPGTQNSVFSNVADTQAPTLISATALDATTVQVVFSEVLYDAASLSANNFTVNNGVGTATAAALVSENTLNLTFSTNITPNIAMTITAATLRDCSGNTNTNKTAVFTYRQTVAASRYDILLNEIFVDPSNSLGVPAQEYIELYNRSNKYIQLDGMQILSGNSACVLPFYVFEPNTYLIITGNGGEDFTGFGTTFALSDFISLSNPTATTGDDVRIINTSGSTIDAILYDKTWWKGSATTKALERVNALKPCDEAENWKASTSNLGGTPGTVNSTNETTADTDAPKVVRTVVQGNRAVRVYFNKAIDTNTAANMFTIDNGIGTPASILVGGPYFRSALLTLTDTLKPSIIYTITIATTLKDCIGNAIAANTTAKVVLPEACGKKDIVINEILNHPKTGGIQFIELYNRSKKVIDLNGFIIAARSTDTTERIGINYLLFPDDYVVLTENDFILQNQNNVRSPEKIIQMPLPTLSFGGDSFFILNNGTLVDSIDYTENWHSELIGVANSTGISLERINPNGYTNDKNNWHSAAASVGYATPTYRNSQYFESAGTDNGEVVLDPPTFSPDDDGIDDFTNVVFKDGQPGYVATVTIYDVQGRPIKPLVKTQLLGTNDVLKWDGTNSAGQKMPIGIYIFAVTMFNSKGDVKQFKKTVVLAGKL
jgi:Lamin Tail Domain